MVVINFLLHVTGIDNTGGKWYAFWSGFAGDLFIFGGLAGFYHKHNCHISGCLRIGKHLINGTPYCSQHIPARTNP